MKRTLTCLLTLCLLLCTAQGVFAAPIPDSDETSDHTIVRIWVTDGKNLPDTNENNPILSVRVVDENGILIPDASIRLLLVKPVLTEGTLVKSEQNGSTTPTQGTPPAAVKYKVFGPDSPQIEYRIHADAENYRDQVTEPFTINFNVSGTIEVVLRKRDPVKDISLTYVVRKHDKAQLEFTHADITKGNPVGSEHVPLVIVPNNNTEKWKFDGYYIDGKKYTAQELAAFVPYANTTVEIRSFPDKNDDGTDDRTEGSPTPGPVITPTPTASPETPETGSAGGYKAYLLFFSVSLVLLVLVLIFVLYRTAQEKKKTGKTKK